LANVGRLTTLKSVAFTATTENAYGERAFHYDDVSEQAHCFELDFSAIPQCFLCMALSANRMRRQPLLPLALHGLTKLVPLTDTSLADARAPLASRQLRLEAISIIAGISHIDVDQRTQMWRRSKFIA
jgi:hypothetical protein